MWPPRDVTTTATFLLSDISFTGMAKQKKKILKKFIIVNKLS